MSLGKASELMTIEFHDDTSFNKATISLDRKLSMTEILIFDFQCRVHYSSNTNKR